MRDVSLRLLLCASIFVPCGCEVAKVIPPKVEYAPVLGRPFGTLLDLKCVLVDPPPGMRAIDPVIRVTAIDGHALNAPVDMRWIYGGSVPSDLFEAPYKGPVMSLASEYLIRGYECGQFVGEPNGVWEITSPLYGPRPTHFYWVSLFHVLTVAPAY